MSELNIAKAVRSNAIYASHLRWLRHYPRILSTIGITHSPKFAGVFVEKLATWQCSVGGLHLDGMLGPKTWQKLHPRLVSLAVRATIPDWLRSPVAQGWRQAIIHTLRENTSFLRLTNRTHRIVSNDFIGLADLIEKDLITIETTRQTSASYEFRNEELDANSIKVPHRVAHSWRSTQGLIVHEACHAISDVKGKRQPIFDEEMTAFVVQRMFLEKFKVSLLIGNSNGRIIHAAAAPLAIKYLKGKAPDNAEWEELRNVLRRHPFYAGKDREFPVLRFDGVNQES